MEYWNSHGISVLKCPHAVCVLADVHGESARHLRVGFQVFRRYFLRVIYKNVLKSVVFQAIILFKRQVMR